jgi:hypothetical protein
MSTSIMYHCFGIAGRGLRYVRTLYKNGRTIFRIDQDPTSLECSV